MIDNEYARGTSGPQDTVRGRAYASPIPPLEERHEHRYIPSEPLGPAPRSSFGPFTGPAGPAVRLPRKSIGLAVLLAFFLGPIGMLYSTFLGALTTFFLSGVAILLPHVAAAPVWLFGILWAALAAHRKNERARTLEAWMRGR